MKATQYRRGSVNSSPDIVTTTYTDALGNEVKTGRVIGGVERIDTHTFDHLGNKLTTLTALDATRNITYSGKWECDYAGRVVREYQALPAGGVEVFSTSAYDALGNLAAPVAGDLNPFRYCGEYFDKGSETYYLRARYYNPRTGCFTRLFSLQDLA